MSDWYDDSQNELMFDIAMHAGIDQDTARKVYNYLFEIGIIDYDIEKEMLWELYGCEMEGTGTEEFDEELEDCA